jgi:hypothetical protein
MYIFTKWAHEVSVAITVLIFSISLKIYEIIIPNSHYSKLIAVITTIVLYAFIRIIAIKSRPLDFYRKNLYTQSKVEGVWITFSTIEGRPWACAQIKYDGNSDCWIYEGEAFDKDGNPAARWITRSLYMSKAVQGINRWLFDGEAYMIDHNIAGNPEGPKGKIFQIVRFNKNRPTRIVVNATDENVETGAVIRHFSVYGVKISADDIKMTLSKPKKSVDIFEHLVPSERFTLVQSKMKIIETLMNQNDHKY